MAELGKAYIQIVPSAKGISGSISSALGGESISAGKSAGVNIAGAIKGAIAAAGIGTAIKSALEAGGNLQQSFGGLETLYGEAADAAKKYAVEAASAGISANSYAEQAVSFGAALKQAFEGDTVKAAEAANTAILDMADNSAKMGTDITSIQTAYQGFAKQNYTMLDNLKLGYGGTKSEMERLLADAQQLSGVEYNLDNLGDVYSAIHVIQENLGLTGVAAQEASTTFTGSLGAMKAAGENLLANLALGEDIRPALDTLGQTVSTFLFNNLFPMVGNIFKALPDLLSGLGSMLIGTLNQISANSDELVQTGIQIVTSLVSAIVEAAPYLVEAAWNLAASLGKALMEADWATIGTNLLTSIKNSIDLAAGEILGQDTATVDGFLSGITNALPNLLSTGIDFISNVASGIFSALPELITIAGDLVVSFASFLLENAPQLLDSGFQLLSNLASGLISNLPAIGSAALQVISKLLFTIASNAPKILQTGIEIIGKLVVGLIQAIPKIVAAIPQIINAIKETFGAYDWASIGKNLLEGIKNGILGAVSSVVNAAKEAAESIWNTVKSFFDINSPSGLFEWGGKMLDYGLAGGIEKNTGIVEDAMDSLNEATVSHLQTEMNVTPKYENVAGQTTDSKIDSLMSLLDTYLPVLADGMNVTLEGGAEKIFNVVKNENKIYKRMNGQSAFA
jgi:phage-related protein